MKMYKALYLVSIFILVSCTTPIGVVTFDTPLNSTEQNTTANISISQPYFGEKAYFITDSTIIASIKRSSVVIDAGDNDATDIVRSNSFSVSAFIVSINDDIYNKNS